MLVKLQESLNRQPVCEYGLVRDLYDLDDKNRISEVQESTSHLSDTVLR